MPSATASFTIRSTSSAEPPWARPRRDCPPLAKSHTRNMKSGSIERVIVDGNPVPVFADCDKSGAADHAEYFTQSLGSIRFPKLCFIDGAIDFSFLMAT